MDKNSGRPNSEIYAQASVDGQNKRNRKVSLSSLEETCFSRGATQAHS